MHARATRTPDPGRERPTPERRRSGAAAFPLALLAVLVLVPGAAANDVDGVPETVPDDATLESSGAVIGEIAVVNGNVFDVSIPQEDRAPFRLANRLHVKTRENTLRALVLFRTGDRYSRAILDESERILRAQRYLYDADIRPTRFRDGVVDVTIRTRDVWTLKPSLGIGRAGGANTVRIGIEEENLLGRGKSLAFRRTRDVDRVSSLFRYRDPNLFGRRGRLELAYSDNSDGKIESVDLGRPFYAFDARWSARVFASEEDRVDRLYTAGKVRDRFRHRLETTEAHVGWSDGIVRGVVSRWKVGFTFDRHRFEDAPGRPPAIALPEDRTLAYPWVEYARVRPGFVEATDVDRIARTEDLDLGRRLRVRVGRSTTAFGADRDRNVVESEFFVGAAPAPGRLVFGSAFASARSAGASDPENARVGGEISFFVRDFGRHLFTVKLAADAAYRLDGEEQLLLGGEEGLRGYPLRYVEGDRRFLVTVEQRFYTDWHVLRLVRVGAAVFADVGAAWFAGDEFDLLRDVGLGLRLGSSRSSLGSMVHVDVAFPLDGDPSISRVQFLVKSMETF